VKLERFSVKLTGNAHAADVRARRFNPRNADFTSKWITKRCAVSTKPLARRTLRVTSLRCSSANELARCCDSSYHRIAAGPSGFTSWDASGRPESVIIKKNTIEIPLST
jgi:hypothetical protein